MIDRKTGKFVRLQVRKVEVQHKSCTIRAVSTTRPSQEEIKKALELANKVKKKQNNFLYE